MKECKTWNELQLLIVYWVLQCTTGLDLVIMQSLRAVVILYIHIYIFCDYSVFIMTHPGARRFDQIMSCFNNQFNIIQLSWTKQHDPLGHHSQTYELQVFIIVTKSKPVYFSDAVCLDILNFTKKKRRKRIRKAKIEYL